MMLKLKDFFELKSNKQILTEAIQFDHGNNYGQVVIMAGGPASGKGFVKDYILDVANYKTRDVDELKKKHLNLLKSKYKQNKEFTEEELKILKPLLEKHNLDVKSYLGDSEQLSLLHEFVKKRINIKLNLTHEIPIFHEKIMDWLETYSQLSPPLKLIDDFKKWFVDYVRTISNRSIKSLTSDSNLNTLINKNYKFFEIVNDINDPKIQFRLKKFIDSAIDTFKQILNNEDDFPKDIDQLLKSLDNNKETELPNLLFDITFKDTWYLDSIIPKLFEIGYKPENINLVWVLVDLNEAKNRNANRDRVVSTRIINEIHAHVIKNILTVLKSKDYIPDVINGDIYVIDNKTLNDLDDISENRKKSYSQNIQYKTKDNKISFILSDVNTYKIKTAGNPKIKLGDLKDSLKTIDNNIKLLKDNPLLDRVNKKSERLVKLLNREIYHDQ